jgi:hypothetical protein
VHGVVILNDYVVKFSNRNMLNEGDTQAFVYEASKCSSNAPRVPKVYECFSSESVEYLAMERVHLPTVESWINDTSNVDEQESRTNIAAEGVANALSWLFNLSVPLDSRIGLIEGKYALTQSEDVRAKTGRARNRLFGDFSAPLRYTSAVALQHYINKV